MMIKRILATLALAPALAMAGCSTASDSAGVSAAGGWIYPTLGREKPIVIGHRGASGALPEHTLEAYQRALNDGADCIEPDLVITKDGQLAVRHDTYLSTTTNVASKPEFANRKRRSTDPEYEGRVDWWVSDFTMAELKTLRAVQPFPGRAKVFDGLYQIPTFDQVLEMAKSRLTVASQKVCVYPEAKSPAYFASVGHPDMAEKILAALDRHGMAGAGSPVFIQSFEPDFVQKIDGMTELPVVMLVADRAGYDAAMAMPGAPFWQGLGPNLSLLMDASGKSTGIVEAAHAKGIRVHPWTFRDDAPIKGEAPEQSIKRYLALGIDGFFTDFPFTGYKVRNDVLYDAE
jgi:glycerophosphoryl diester phosphodiesterase